MKRILVCMLISLGACAFGQPGKLMLQLADGVDASAIASDYNITLLDTTPDAPFALYLAANPEGTQLAMAGDARVVWVEDDVYMRMPEHDGAGKASTIGSLFNKQLFMQFNQPLLSQANWAQHAPGGIIPRVAVLDTGLSPNAVDVWPQVHAMMNAVEVGQPPHDIPRGTDSNQNGFLDEGVGHGTMITTVVAMMAPDCRLVIGRVADSDGNASCWSITKGIAFAVAQSCRLANISLGASEDYNPRGLGHVVEWADTKGLLVVGSAGNNGRDLRVFPGGYDVAIGVTAIDSSDHKSFFANWDSHVDVAAPGELMKSCFWTGEFAQWNGTSFAAPMVTAGLANAISLNGLRRNADLRAAVALGNNIDAINPSYEGKIGRKLNIEKLISDVAQQQGYATIEGHVTFGLLTGPIPTSVELDVMVDGVSYGKVPVRLSPSGEFFVALPAGSLTLRLKHTHWLRYKKWIDGPDGQTVPVEFRLINGDAIGDNSVDLYDLNSVLVHYGQKGSVADLNEDGIVNLYDLNVTLLNFGLVGD